MNPKVEPWMYLKPWKQISNVKLVKVQITVCSIYQTTNWKEKGCCRCGLELERDDFRVCGWEGKVRIWYTCGRRRDGETADTVSALLWPGHRSGGQPRAGALLSAFDWDLGEMIPGLKRETSEFVATNMN